MELGSRGSRVAPRKSTTLDTQPESVREAADLALERDLGLPVEGVGRNRRSPAGGKGEATELTLPPGGVVLRPSSEGEIGLRRLGDVPFVDYRLQPRRSVELAIPTDGSPSPWIATIEGAVVVCDVESA